MIRARADRSRQTLRRWSRPGAVLLAAFGLAWLPTMASAAPTDDLPGHAATFTVVDGILVFGVAPVGVFLLVALVVMRPGSSPRAQRYRPGRAWGAAPSWTGLQPSPTRTDPTSTPGSDGPVLLPTDEGGHHNVPVMAGAPHQAHADTQADHDADVATRADTGSEHDPTGDATDEPRPVVADPAAAPGRTGGAYGSW